MRYAVMAGCLLVGVITAALFANDLLPNRTVEARFDLVAVALTAVALVACAVAAFAWHGRDIAKLQRAIDAALASSDDDRRRFVRRLDHELTNPLTAIRAGLANLSPELPESEREVTLAMIKTQVVRASSLISDLRKLADLELRPLETALVDPTSLLREVVDVIGESPTGRDRNISVSLPAAPWPLPQVVGDRDLLFLAIHNLLDNALKFSSPDDMVEVRGFEDDGMVAVEIADTGVGIAHEDTPHVWEELYRGSFARGTAGSGLGLSLVRSVSQRHGASLSLRSKPGKGTVVTLRLPVAPVTDR